MFVHPEGEVIAAAGAENSGALYESSGASNRPLEDIAKANKGAKWFQLYFNADTGVTKSLLERAKAAGYSAIIITADALGPGIEFVKKITGLPVILKGILRGDDAETAIQAGADAIQVSNHGGRQIDGVPAAISQLQEVASRVGHKVPIIFDSGIRRGIDIVRALSLG
ncbi:alpha-hydroxy-acid oxidizing protein, partial [Klebsiella pneumoniae]|uniref:alpha-hydroxy-acid oxidizing protein n=1 Tax=Klebsiella pneumoniae TaxID=573 RepID=UPI002166D64A